MKKILIVVGLVLGFAGMVFAASNTTNLNLRKPATTDTVSSTTDLNDNWDIIDAAIGGPGGQPIFDFTNASPLGVGGIDLGVKIRTKTTADNGTGALIKALDAEARVSGTGAELTNLEGGTITAHSYSGISSLDTAYGLKVESKMNGTITGTNIGLDIRMFRQSAVPPTTERAMQIRNYNALGTGLDAGIWFESNGVNGGDDDDFTYIIDMNSADAGTADIRLSNGETIKNTTDTEIEIDGFLKLKSSADSAAPNSSLYYSTDQSKLVYKDSGGTVRNLW